MTHSLDDALAYAKEYLAGTYEIGAIAEIQKIEGVERTMQEQITRAGAKL